MSSTVATAQQKSVGTAYLLWFFLGAVGAHQFYLGKTGRAISYIFTLGWLGIGLLIDLFTLPKQVAAVNGTPAA
ncbi:TM2 domain-containing protein [Actinomycetes bacterium KLBMP 9797]